MAPLTLQSFVRELPSSACRKLGRMLDPGDYWEDLVSIIPRDPDMLFQDQHAVQNYRYTMEAVATINLKSSKTEFLLKDWGRQNCQIRHLIKALLNANLIASAEYLQSNVLRLPPDLYLRPAPPAATAEQVPPTPSVNPALSRQSQPVKESDVECVCESGGKSVCENVPESIDDRICLLEVNSPPGITVAGRETPDGASRREAVESSEKSLEKDTSPFRDMTECQPLPPSVGASAVECTSQSEGARGCTEFPVLLSLDYGYLQRITNGFNRDHVTQGGRLVGQGGFGLVFLGTLDDSGLSVAIKRLTHDTEENRKQFNNEVETLCTYRHENLVNLLGFSSNGELQCLVYEFMPNGSLEDRLACDYNTQPLSIAQRIQIAKGTAKGIAFLHSKAVTHRDIKSANILLDVDFKPKVGDFATAKVAPSGMKTKINSASSLIGTQPYLAPEAYDFKIHPGLDIFSFGVVLLELITGLPVIDNHREERDLKIFVEEHCAPDEDDHSGDIYDLRDKKVSDEWNRPLVQNLYTLSERCLNRDRRHRIKIEAIIIELGTNV